MKKTTNKAIAQNTNKAAKKVTATAVEKKTTDKKNGVAEKKTALLAKVEKDLTVQKLSWTVNKKGHYIFKMADKEGKKYAVKIALFQKENTYRIYCNKTMVDRMALTEKQYTFHQGWAVPYTLNITLNDMAKALQKAAPKKEVKKEEVEPVAV